MRLSDSGESINVRNADHVYSSGPLPAFVVGEVVWSLFPYLNLTKKCCDFDLLSVILML